MNYKKTEIIKEEYEGVLQLNRFIDKKLSYCIYNNVKVTNDNISQILDKLYMDEKEIDILIYEKMNNYTYTYLKETGILEYKKDDGVYELFLNDVNLDIVLWNLIGHKIKIIIKYFRIKGECEDEY